MKTGTIRSDGYAFQQYQRSRKGTLVEVWLSPAARHRACISRTLTSARKRASDKDVLFDIDAEYLLSIFPSDGMCHALNIPLIWGRGRTANSPALDRRVPTLGYVRGNLAFISDKANRIKSDATAEEVQRVATYLKG